MEMQHLVACWRAEEEEEAVMTPGTPEKGCIPGKSESTHMHGCMQSSHHAVSDRMGQFLPW